MAQRAAKIFLPVSNEAEVETPLSGGLRDFTQPWMDLNDKGVLVTGGTGSFGKHFVKTVIEHY
jgi:UDP-N-acetylglucosamine 4,6-dehydratase